MKLKKLFAAICAAMLIVCIAASLGGCGKKVTVQATVGILLYEMNGDYSEMLEGYRDSLNSRYAEGEVAYLEKNAQGDASRFPALIEELVNEGVNAIAAFGDEAAQAAVGQDLSVPVFFVGVSDAQALALVKDPQAPDRNATGSEISVPATQLIEQSRKLVESASYGVIYDSSDMTGTHAATLIGIALSKVGVPFDMKGATSPEEATAVAKALLQDKEALILTNNAVIEEALDGILAAADEKKAPVFVFSQSAVERGATLGVTVTMRESGALVGQYTYQALQGNAVSTLPVISNVSGIQTCLNMRKAVELGYTVNDEFLNTAMLIDPVELPVSEADGEGAESAE